MPPKAYRVFFYVPMKLSEKNHNGMIHSPKFKLGDHMTARGIRKMASYQTIRRKIRDVVYESEPAAEAVVSEMEGGRGAYPGSFEERIKLLNAAVSKLSQFSQYMSDEPSSYCPVNVVATFDDYAYLYDYRAERYFYIEYENDGNDQPRVTTIQTAEPELVVKEQADDVREYFRAALLDPKPDQIPGLMAMAGHIEQYAGAED